MTRLLVAGLLIVVLWLGVKSLAVQLKASVLGQGKGRHEPLGGPRAAETLVRCTGCGAFVLASRAVKVNRAGDEVFCSEECRQRGAA